MYCPNVNAYCDIENRKYCGRLFTLKELRGYYDDLASYVGCEEWSPYDKHHDSEWVYVTEDMEWEDFAIDLQNIGGGK